MIDESQAKAKWESWLRADEGKWLNKARAIANEYPIHKSLFVKYKDIDTYDADLSEALLEKPEMIIKQAELAIYDALMANCKHQLNLRIIDLPEDFTKVKISLIRETHVNKFIMIEGIVRKITDVRPRILQAAFQCKRCMQITWMDQSCNDTIDYPLDCSTCHKHAGQTRFSVVTDGGPDSSTFIDSQVTEIQEPQDTLEGSYQPRPMEIYCEDDLTGFVNPGQRIIVNGVVKSRQKSKGPHTPTTFDVFFIANSIQRLEQGFEEIKISEDDYQKIKLLSVDPELQEKIIASIAPSIYGMRDEKEALAIQLFGGVRKLMRDGTWTRGDIHILMVGDPGTAKSQLLNYIAKLAPRGIYTSGKSSSSAGLTATAIRSDEHGQGRWSLEAGALVLADKGTCCIDELDKMSPTDRESIHSAMEQQVVAVAKAGITTTLMSRCSVLAAANPTLGRFSMHKLLAEQIDLDPPLLTRFDIIFTIQDAPDKDRDALLARHIIDMHYLESARMEHKADGTNRHEEDINKIQAIKDPPIPTEFLRKYIAFAKMNIHPVMTPLAMDKINDVYVAMRMSGGGETVPLTPRNLEALIRIAESSARMHLRKDVLEEDAVIAIRIITGYLSKVSSIDGKIDADIIYTRTGGSQRDRLWGIIDILKDIQGGDGANIDDIKKLCLERGVPVECLEDDIDKLKVDGRIYQKPSHKYLLT